MKDQRYDIEAGRNVLNMLKETSPADYDLLMRQLVAQAQGGQLGAADEDAPGFWSQLFSAGAGALATIADYKLQEQQDKVQQAAKQDAYEQAVETEMQRQSFLAAQAKSQALEFQNQMELSRQSVELQNAADRAKSKFNWALAAVGGLLGLWVLYRVVV